MITLYVPFRHANLQLLQQYGGNAWKVHNYLLEADAKAVEADLEVLKNRVTEVNRDRKNSQVSNNHSLGIPCYYFLSFLIIDWGCIAFGDIAANRENIDGTRDTVDRACVDCFTARARKRRSRSRGRAIATPGARVGVIILSPASAPSLCTVAPVNPFVLYDCCNFASSHILFLGTERQSLDQHNLCITDPFGMNLMHIYQCINDLNAPAFGEKR